jgi:hypothetical protein
MTQKRSLTDEQIAEIVQGIAAPDWTQIELLRNLPAERRIVPAMRARAFAMATYRANLRRRYPDLSSSEINMKVLAHFTEVRLQRP